MSSSYTDMHHQVFDSNSTQLAAIFPTQHDADAAVASLTADTAVAADQVAVLTPQESDFSRKLEKDARSLGRQMLSSHVTMGGIGVILGLVIALLLVMFGPALTQQNPLFTFIALISPGLFIGMFIAGLFSLRPDRTALVETVRHALKQKRVAVIVNLRKSQPYDKIKAVLSRQSVTVVEARR